MGCFQTEQPLTGKEVIRPELVIFPSTSTAFPMPTSQNRAQAASQPTVQSAEDPWAAVLEIFKPADQCAIHIDNDRLEALTRIPFRLRPQRVLEFLLTLLTRPMAMVAKVIAQKIKAFRADVNDLRFRRMQGQTIGRHPALNEFQRTSGLVGGSAQDHESSSPGESHPRALTEPDVNLSTHPALIVQSQVEFRFAKARTSSALGGQYCPTSERLVEHGERNV